MTKAVLDRTPVIHEVYPYLCVSGGAAAIDFYVRVFGAQELMRLTYPDGRIAHAELKLGPATLMLADEQPEFGNSQSFGLRRYRDDDSSPCGRCRRADLPGD